MAQGAKIEVEREDYSDDEFNKLANEINSQSNKNKQNKAKQEEKEKEKSEERRELFNSQSTDLVKVKQGSMPVSDSDETSRNLRVLSDEEQAAIRKRNLDRKTSYYHSEAMKKEHIIPLRVSVNEESGEELWEEKKYRYHELTYEEADRLEELRATMDDLEKQTFLFNRERAVRYDPEYNIVKRKWQSAKRNWAFYGARAFLHMPESDINRCKSTTLINVIEACEYRQAVTVPY